MADIKTFKHKGRPPEGRWIPVSHALTFKLFDVLDKIDLTPISRTATRPDGHKGTVHESDIITVLADTELALAPIRFSQMFLDASKQHERIRESLRKKMQDVISPEQQEDFETAMALTTGGQMVLFITAHHLKVASLEMQVKGLVDIEADDVWDAVYSGGVDLSAEEEHSAVLSVYQDLYQQLVEMNGAEWIKVQHDHSLINHLSTMISRHFGETPPDGGPGGKVRGLDRR